MCAVMEQYASGNVGSNDGNPSFLPVFLDISISSFRTMRKGEIKVGFARCSRN